MNSYVSPWMDEDLTIFRNAATRFLEAEMVPNEEQWRKQQNVGKDIWRKAGAMGFLCTDVSAEYGGVGGDFRHEAVLYEELARRGLSGFGQGVHSICAHYLLNHGTEAQKHCFLPRMASGELIGAIGMTEPGAGSDLQALKTRAVRDGDDYVINGTKIWTTGAHVADHMFCLVRTSTEGKPQDGISFVLIDSMKTPGLSVAPILTLAGDHEVNQVFFDNVRTPVANCIGPENAGWTVAKYLLEFERGGDAYTPNLYARIDDIRRIAREEAADGSGRLIAERGFAERLAEAELEAQALEMIEMQVLSDLSRGRNPGAVSSAMKIRGSETLQKLDHLGVEALAWYAAPFEPEARMLGHNAPTVTPEWGITAMPLYLNNRASTIYAGSNEIQRNIIAKMTLGL
jgi:alkylation response protein AidB-like acyl-CoA dehydrogenase